MEKNDIASPAPMPPQQRQLAIKLKNFQAAAIAQTLEELFARANSNDLIIVAEPKSNSLLVGGTAAQQEAIRLIVDRLETAATVNRTADPRRPVEPPINPTK